MVKKFGGTTEIQTTNTNTIYIIIILILIIIIIAFFITYVINNKITQNISIKNEQPPVDQFFNIYSPPLRNTPPFSNTSYNGLYGFTQIGILKYHGNNEHADFLPLFGRPLSTSRNQWQYYTLSNTGSLPGIKLSLRNEKGRNLMDDTGAPELYDDDTVIADGYDKPMQVSLYKQKQLYYI